MSDRLQKAIDEWYEAETGPDGLILDYEQLVYDAARRWLAVEEALTGELDAVSVEDDETYRIELLIPRNEGTAAWCREYLGESCRLVPVDAALVDYLTEEGP